MTRIENNFSLNNNIIVYYRDLHLFLNDVGIKVKVRFMPFEIRKLRIHESFETYKNNVEYNMERLLCIITTNLGTFVLTCHRLLNTYKSMKSKVRLKLI